MRQRGIGGDTFFKSQGRGVGWGGSYIFQGEYFSFEGRVKRESLSTIGSVEFTALCFNGGT